MNSSIKLYYKTLRIRLIENRIVEEYKNQKIRCPIHLSIGQEAISSPLSIVFNKNDYVVSNHRSHAHYLGKGGNLKKFIAEIYGKEDGCSGGRGGSMHLNDKESGFVASTPIVANSIPIGVGLALSKKIKNEKGIVIIFLGDGAIEEGVFYESLNFAILKNLRIIFVCENNLYSVYSKFEVRQPKLRKIYKMVSGFNIKSFCLNGNSFEKNYKFYKKALKYVNKNNKPLFVEFLTYRFIEHCGPNADDNLNYRIKKEISHWRKKDPIKSFEKKNRELILKKKHKFVNIIEKEIDGAFEYAKNSKFASYKSAYTKLYAKS